MHTIKNTVWAGVPLDQAKRVLIMTHGRGASAQSILSLAAELAIDGFALAAPQATGNTWYPYSFLAPEAQNEPGLSSGLAVLKELLDTVKAAGILSKNVYFLGFSQGACLTSEFVARHAQLFGGVFILSGGVIGDTVKTERYTGDFAGTPIFLGCSDVDAHVPKDRVQDSSEVFRTLGATVTERIYPNAPHSIFQDEIDHINHILTTK
jgi:phospholipase/carboxylesterase